MTHRVAILDSSNAVLYSHNHHTTLLRGWLYPDSDPEGTERGLSTPVPPEAKIPNRQCR